MNCPMCGKPIEGNASDILPGRKLCEVCADNIRTFSKGETDAQRQAACAYIQISRETTQDADVRTAIDALLKQHGVSSAADASNVPDTPTPPVSAQATPLPQRIEFGDSGPKITSAADILCVLGVLVSVVLGFLLIVTGMNSRQGGVMIIIGISVAIAGSLVSWFVSLLARGFGEMVNNVRIQTELAVRNHSGKE
ncbi:MAG: hypothetical protein ACI4ML_00725 [Aristaeellaceae bacterium]